MHDRRASFTAAFVAACRGLGPLLPARLRIVDDPYGAHLAHAWLGALVDGIGAIPKPLRAAAWGPLLPLFPWAVYMQVRTRAIDDALREAVARGCRQVVILGAGLDARAVRLAAELGGVTVFEVDHPATQTYKRDALARVGASSPARYVAWNFERDPLDRLVDALADVGYDRATPTFTVWEGVTMYLTRAAIEATLAAVHDYGPVGSEIALNYVDRARAEGRGPASRVVGGVVRGVGEPFVSGFEHAEMASLLERAGFTVSRNASLAAWAKALLPGRWGDGVGLGGNLAIARRAA